jgi:streptogramin lyase
MTKQPRLLEMSRGGCLTLWMVVAALGLASRAYSQTFTEFPIPGTVPTPWGITAGPDGNLWFTEFQTNKIGRISTADVITEFAVPTLIFSQSIVAGPDGALWFISQTGKIGRITTAGVVTEFAVTADSLLTDIASGPDGNLWLTETDRSTVGGGPSGRPKIGRITTAGVVTEFPLSPFAQPLGIAAGPDGALWFADADAKIGRITTAGVITEFPVPAANPRSITAGPDGNLWFTETTYSFVDNPATGRIGRISTSGVVTEFPIPTANSIPPPSLPARTARCGSPRGQIIAASAVTISAALRPRVLSRSFRSPRPAAFLRASRLGPTALSGLPKKVGSRSVGSPRRAPCVACHRPTSA